MSNFGHCLMCPSGTRPTLLTDSRCAWHYQNPGEVIRTEEEDGSKLSRPIKPRSTKRSKQEKEYTRLRKEFLAVNQECAAQLEGCTKSATEVHHQIGRSGDLLIDTNFFFPICHNCHMYVTEHSSEAIARGFSLPRNHKNELGKA